MIQTVNINVAALPALRGPGSFMVLSQNENGRQLRFRILGSDLPTGCTATFSGTKPDGNVYSTTGTVSGNFVIVQEDIQMTAVAGIWDAKLEIAKGTENIVTSIIRVTVVRDPVAGDAIPSDSQLDGIVTEVKYYAEHARSEAYGSPLTASTKSAMTDKTRVYVYTGSESGMTAGNWYYWNGSAWVSGGVYNAVAVQTDTTLSVAGKAADGKAAGDAIEELKEDLNNIKDTLTYEKPLLADASSLAGNNNTAITNNNDGTYTVGTTDYGITTFGGGVPINLEPGDYYLYGVPNGMSFLSTTYPASTAYKNKIFENQNAYPKVFHTDVPISVYVGFRSPSAPVESYTITPSLYKIAVKNKELYRPQAISLNGNYFEDTAESWTDGHYKTANGVIESSDTLQYAFCPVIGEGNYTELVQYAVFGVTTNVIALVDKEHNFVKSITGVRDGDNVTFSITEEDTLQCKYIVIRRDKTKTFSPKLFYNSTARGGIYPLTPNYGYISDPLYKKIIVCDGDSICYGYKDEPKQYGSWFGRLQNDYQVSGHNYAVSGATITDMRPSVSHSVALNIDTIYSEYPTLDYLILEGGTNDSDRIGNFIGDTPPEGFGTWSDESASDYNGGYDNTTFCGAVDEMFYKAVTYYPDAKIGFIIPMQMGTYTTSSKRRRRYFDEIVKIANKWHVNVLDLWNICHADARIPVYYSGTEGDLTKFYYDGQHPTSVGYDLMQPIIEAWLKTL